MCCRNNNCFFTLIIELEIHTISSILRFEYLVIFLRDFEQGFFEFKLDIPLSTVLLVDPRGVLSTSYEY